MVLAPRPRARSTSARLALRVEHQLGAVQHGVGHHPGVERQGELLVAVDDRAALLLAHPAPAQREHRPQAGVRRGGHVQLGHGGPSIPWSREPLPAARIRVEQVGEQHDGGRRRPAPTDAASVGPSPYGVAVAVVLFGVGFLVRSKWGPLQTLDDEIIAAATSFTRPRDGLRSFLIAWQWLTQPIRLYAVGTALCLWVWLAKGLRTRAWWAFGTMMVAWFIGLVAKYGVPAGPPGRRGPGVPGPRLLLPLGPRAELRRLGDHRRHPAVAPAQAALGPGHGGRARRARRARHRARPGAARRALPQRRHGRRAHRRRPRARLLRRLRRLEPP